MKMSKFQSVSSACYAICFSFISRAVSHNSLRGFSGKKKFSCLTFYAQLLPSCKEIICCFPNKPASVVTVGKVMSTLLL